MYKIGDKAQAYDGRIGIVTEAEMIGNYANLPNYQDIIVKFPDQSTMNGASDKFKAVLERQSAPVTVYGGSKKCPMRSDEISTKNNLELIVSK